MENEIQIAEKKHEFSFFSIFCVAEKRREKKFSINSHKKI